MSLVGIEEKRKRQFIRKTIQKFGLNLDGLTVFTEAATGNYKYTAIIAALAGAEQVFAVTADSKYGKKEAVRAQTLKEAKELGVDNKVTILFERDKDRLSKSDIVTNSGFVRPITREMVSYMKPTAVIPLMWETWEFRAEELDLEACREREILVMGTNEHHPLLDLFRSNGFLICKLLFDKGFDVYKDNLLLIASGHIGDSAADFFISNDISFDRVVFDDKVPEHQRAFVRSRDGVIINLPTYDAIIIAEHHHNVDILSRKGVIPVDLLKEKNPLIQIIHICGSINKDDIVREGLAVYPEDIMPFGYMGVSPDYLGPKTLLELNTAGLKVGEVMARCRLRGMSIKDTIEYTIKNSPAMDFEGGFSIMKNDLFLDEDLLSLWQKLQSLHFRLRDYTKKKYNRVNPFNEELFDWKEKGRYFGGVNVTVYDSTIISGNVKIGGNTWIGPFCSIDGTGGLTIGCFCCISTGVRVLTHDTVRWALSGGKCEYEYAPTSIGNCCFIGVNSIILRGVRIGNHCLIGAGSIVNRDLPDFSIAAGVPAEIIGKVEIKEGKVELKYFKKKIVE